jgi:hypothetical protein
MTQMPSSLQLSSALKHSCGLLLGRLEALEARLEAADDAAWVTYTTTVRALAALLPHVTPGSHGQLMTTREMAARLGIAPKTLLGKTGIRPAVRLGKRGRGAIRWREDEAS